MIECETGFGPPEPVETTFEPAGRWADTDDSTEAGSSPTVQELYATALAKAEVSRCARIPLPLPVEIRTAPAGGTTPARRSLASRRAVRRFEAVVIAVRAETAGAPLIAG